MIDRAAIRLSPRDNVATALRDLAEGETIEVDGIRIAIGEAVPLCHKLALSDVARGSEVVKYGLPIGRATAPIARGTLVHVHNMRSSRAM